MVFWHGLRSMRRTEAQRRKASALRFRRSQSLAGRRHRLSQARVRSTIQLGSATNLWKSDRLTIARVTWPPQLQLAPDLLGHLNAEPQLGPLLLDGQQIAFLGAGETALRADRQLLQRGVFRRFVDAALQHVLALQLTGLAGDETEH